MSLRPKWPYLLASLTWCFGVSTPGLCAEGEPPIYTETVTIPERGEVTGYVLAAKAYRLSFIPPADWSVKYDPDKGTATVLPPGLEAGMSINIAVEPPKATVATLADRIRDKVRERYPDATINSEYKCFAGGRAGWAVDFERRIESEGVRTTFRLACFEFDEGTVEFELKASNARFPQYHHAFGTLLNSLTITFPTPPTNQAALPTAPNDPAGSIR